jgi:hypothetical protein
MNQEYLFQTLSIHYLISQSLNLVSLTLVRCSSSSFLIRICLARGKLLTHFLHLIWSLGCQKMVILTSTSFGSRFSNFYESFNQDPKYNHTKNSLLFQYMHYGDKKYRWRYIHSAQSQIQKYTLLWKAFSILVSWNMGGFLHVTWPDILEA